MLIAVVITGHAPLPVECVVHQMEGHVDMVSGQRDNFLGMRPGPGITEDKRHCFLTEQNSMSQNSDHCFIVVHHRKLQDHEHTH